MDELQKARAEIDRIDAQMARLFSERMAAVRGIASYKREHGLPVTDAAREKMMLEELPASIADPSQREAYTALLREILRLSKQYQQQLHDTADNKTVLSTPGCSYDIVIKKGCLSEVGARLKEHRQVLIVTDSGVPSIYAKTVAAQCEHPLLMTVDAGEASKSVSEWQSLLEALLSHHFTRADAIVAVGGGMVGDLSGFTAASYLRGIAFYNIPTTLLAQADAAIGGKTALNLDGIKNSVGAFYQPRAVFIDTETLETLPPRQLANGYAEIIKMAICEDSALFEALEAKDSMDIGQIITRAVAIKTRIVAADEREAGLRRVLNFGHTLGHGIESAAVGSLSHGECVAMGMLPLTDETLRPRLRRLLAAYGLPVRPDFDSGRIREAVTHDKKSQNSDALRVVCVDRPGAWHEEETTVDALLKRAAEVWKETDR